MTLDVAITVDVEFSIGGAFADPDHRLPVGADHVECPVDGRPGGLDYILDMLERHGHKGVFFMEALNTCYFGDAPMGDIARRIHARGHDVQLHAHPCWTTFAHDDWRTRVRDAPPADSFADLDDVTIDRLVRQAVETFARWGLPAPVAFRAGNLAADARLYPALARHGITLASNVGLGVFTPRDAALRLAGGRRRIGATVEIPVASYVDLRLPGMTRWKTFTVIGTGAWEARQWLRSAARSDVGPVVVLTHPSEYVHMPADGRAPARPNAVARGRLADLCAFLAAHPASFEVVTFAERAQRWSREPDTGAPRWGASSLAGVLRVIENRTGEGSRAP
jgi:peptidoglycan/xylan/chitin deacetylase (PgdA/CDA1 family)